MQNGVLAARICDVKRWIRDTLGQARSGNLPKKFSVVSEKENPRVGEPFDVLWVKFDFDADMWDDEMMWDIRYLLMGSKLNKIPGFPRELDEFRDKLFVSRDSISEKSGLAKRN